MKTKHVFIVRSPGAKANPPNKAKSETAAIIYFHFMLSSCVKACGFKKFGSVCNNVQDCFLILFWYLCLSPSWTNMACNERIISAFMDESSIQPQITLCQTLCFTFVWLFPLHSVFKLQAFLRSCTAPTSTTAIFQSDMFEAEKTS